MVEKKIPEHWSELTDGQRMRLLSLADASDEEVTALSEIAKSRVFWLGLWGRLGWLKSAGTIFLTLAAAWTLFRDGLAHALQNFIVPK
jgi:hypothetical protein